MPSVAKQMAGNRNLPMVNPVQKNHGTRQQSIIARKRPFGLTLCILPTATWERPCKRQGRSRTMAHPGLRAGADESASACRRSRAKESHTSLPSRRGGPRGGKTMPAHDPRHRRSLSHAGHPGKPYPVTAWRGAENDNGQNGRSLSSVPTPERLSAMPRIPPEAFRRLLMKRRFILAENH